MNTDYLAHAIVTAVLLTTFAGIYLVLEQPAQLTGAPVVDVPSQNIDTLGTCCCSSQRDIFQVPAGVLNSDLKDTSCERACGEHSTIRHPVVSLGSC